MISAPTPEPPHIVCSVTTWACGNAGPPPLPVSPPPRGGGPGAVAGGPRPLAARDPGAGSRPGAAHLRTGGEEECPRTRDTNPGCNYLAPLCIFSGEVTGPIFHLTSHFGVAERGARVCGGAACPPANTAGAGGGRSGAPALAVPRRSPDPPGGRTRPVCAPL